MWIKRDFKQDLINLATSRPVLVLTGARQTGKTSLIKHCFPDWNFVSLDLPSDAQHAELDPQSFLTHHPRPLVIDEVQYAPGIFRHIKRVVDEQRMQPGQFILTGSQKFTLMKEVSDSLAGRAALLELSPLSVLEIRRHDPVCAIEELMLRGGFPELYANRQLESTQFYRSYVATYLERDLRSVLNVGHLRDFERFLRACALRSGKLLNKSELARDVGISASTSNAWISVLQATNQIALLEPWFSNRSRSITKSPKLYFLDTGLLCFLLNIKTLDELKRSPLVGHIWETFVFCELRKQLERQLETESLFFFRDRNREVDFLIHRGGRFALYEAKWTEHPVSGDLSSMRYFQSIIGEAHIEKLGVICRADRSFPITTDCQAETVVSWNVSSANA